MIRIAICDDQPEELHRLVALTDQALSRRGLDAEVSGFQHPEALLTAIETTRFDLFLLDIVMPMISGLELGQEIRRLDREAQIIYTTAEPQFALRAYAVQPLGYLVKPIDAAPLFELLALAVAKAECAAEQTFAVKIADGLQVLKTSQIASCEYSKHAAVFGLKGGEKLVSRSFRENFSDYCAPLLQDRRFVQCHAAFIVNMRHVERFTKDDFMLCNGTRVPIAEKRYPAVRDAYLDYLASRP